ncbi:hypothetical protein [Terriglobus roseus]|uniref:Uncharacterized protein n=1 Tax=Terriglobus roseus TaxID=392734 RepID=A0A1H4SW87_9BACT|nr:hypothetical protein [Terriglobus roseus]SEC48141.1 hypothetical protein SAMN05443244_3566 [Terriglobus roseus]
MGKRIFGIVVVLLALYLGYYAYQRHLATQAADGAIKIDDTGADTVKDDPTPTAEQTPAPAQKPRAAIENRPTTATDSIQPNPPNGAAFTGTGKFQVYRQGNLTWRVNTETGANCILFATMEEWKKPVVYNHACGNN